MGISSRFWRHPGGGRVTLIGGGIAVTAVGGLVAAALAAGGSAQVAGKADLTAVRVTPDVMTTVVAGGYQFVELGSRQDKTYNELLGINNNGRIAGYFGFGDKGHPNKGYTINAPYAQRNIKSENFPHSAQTQVFGLNDKNVQVGDYSTQNDADSIDDPWFGWYYNGSFHKVVFPTKHNSSPVEDQLSGVNNHDIAVGDYRNSANRFQSFTFNIKTGKFSPLTLPGVSSSTSVEATAINNAGDVAGGLGADGFIKLAGGALHRIVVPGATETFALGLNDNDTVVGVYADSSNTFHGFIWRIGGSLTTRIDDPYAVGPSYLFGINNEGDIVGAYQDSSDGHMDGFLGYPAF
jgi:hypothetical protein